MIDRRQLPLNALRAFEATARRASFTAGAQELSVTQSVISRHVANLEDIIGRKLIERSAQGFGLTPEGEALLPVVEQAFDDIQAAMNLMGASRTLRVHMPPAYANAIGMPLLRAFRKEHPDVAIRVGSSYVTGSPEEKVDVAILFDHVRGDRPDRHLLRRIRFTPMCAPEVAARAAGRPLADVLAGEELLHVLVDGEAYDHLWTEFGARRGVPIPAGQGMTFESFVFAAEYAAGGSGIALGDAGAPAPAPLVAPFPDDIAELDFGYYLVVTPDGAGDPVVDLFRRWILGRPDAA
ncbi:LysR family transcriptional regulator [Sphingomonas histidinilytica]|uniref:LysR family transcriptional regulator, glycine cleavage system transcriptional activator/LysR family transcriptional regulator, regulator of gene expression of beta-lactamase n=1 Tax=Rhizorhabdus histidinilytica TaxID=439228 RepID=A0A1T5BHG7_9SPHN|nr:LysR substrate-binding domain-containing protein [Rhizorhabdus histidinilytica]MBO9379198.1 LysR family transcriptional regulator [Rhizorhabdus histidinilytica]SKB46450.1 LysR family transcriptional regulator, glycine cleavage system transcriptional activator/LysR family transcriptional regulator, regulator of gene expression of beta-lactamase [Rhizorhabdus histidinilytica]